MTLDRHNSLSGKGFSTAYLGLMALMVVACSARLPSQVKSWIEFGLMGIALIGVAMVLVAHCARIEDGPVEGAEAPRR